MLMPQGHEIFCPHCQRSLKVTLQAELRAKTAGTAISCPACGNCWLLRMTPELQFSALSTPRAPRKGRIEESAEDL